MKHNTHINFVGCVELTTAFSAFKKKSPIHCYTLGF